ncbi:chemotaxis protein MotC [Rhizobium taibaishanense]|uniref:Chemotaxis protein MotC n=1 Tax=Allorhizobium taibaishanense TaxID=887144 RepID=A0A7W6MW92_9HYPH|nr:chemotaxis protein MotC [Allorhizobium taibaishanense]
MRSLALRSGRRKSALRATVVVDMLLTLAVGGLLAATIDVSARKAFAAGAAAPAEKPSVAPAPAVTPAPSADQSTDPANALAAGQGDNLPPYMMLRSLQFVQDSVVRGDHSAADMQRFLLTRIDKRLRTALPADYEDPRNVDAALIYAMSGGNPATLEYLVARDINGHFDNRISDMLRKYLSGKGVLMANSIGDMVPLYKNGRIGPYIALVAGNVTVVKDPAAAMKFYDIARLLAPGTIVEEAALRRSVQIAMDTNQNARAMSYANRYARRFLHSPYASQFADLLVQLIVDHFNELEQDDVTATLETMEPDRRREVYLRIARRATINGNQSLARLAAGEAQRLAGLPDNNDPKALLYGGAALIPTTDVKAALNTISQLPQDQLSPSDQALLDAARAVAKEVLTLPTGPANGLGSATDGLAPGPMGAADAVPAAASTSQAADQQQDPGGAAPTAKAPPAGTTRAKAGIGAGGAAPVDRATADPQPQPDPAFQTFISGNRSKLAEIDKMLKGEGVKK